MLPRCGRAAHICGANYFCRLVLVMSRRQIKVFCSSNFLKMLARFRASSPDRCPQAAKFPVPSFWHTERVVRKATAFRGGANKTAPPCFPKAINRYFATVPPEQLQWALYVSHETLLLEKTIFSVRQKGVPPLLLPTSVLQLPRCPV